MTHSASSPKDKMQRLRKMLLPARKAPKYNTLQAYWEGVAAANAAAAAAYAARPPPQQQYRPPQSPSQSATVYRRMPAERAGPAGDITSTKKRDPFVHYKKVQAVIINKILERDPPPPRPTALASVRRDLQDEADAQRSESTAREWEQRGATLQRKRQELRALRLQNATSGKTHKPPSFILVQ